MASLTHRAKMFLAEHGQEPKRFRGQNFCIQPAILDSVVAAASISPKDKVFEIGPGFGFLTERLVSTGAHLTCIEIEPTFAAYVQTQYATQTNVTIAHDDAKEYLSKHSKEVAGSVVVGMIPYNITSYLLRILVDLPNPPKRIVFVLQREVADRIMAKVGNMSLLSVIVQTHMTPRVAKIIGPGNFWPQPKVDSALLILEPKEVTVDKARLIEVAKAGFEHKRKKLISNLSDHFKKIAVEKVFDELGLDKNVRPEQLSIEDWKNLTNRIQY